MCCWARPQSTGRVLTGLSASLREEAKGDTAVGHICGPIADALDRFGDYFQEAGLNG